MVPLNSTGAQMAVVAPAQQFIERREDGELFTTSLVLALGTKVQHKNVLGLVRKHQSSLSKFGEVAFQTRLNQTGTPTEVAVLTEPQSSLLIAFMRNSPVVTAFKFDLVKGFYDMRAALRAQGGVKAPTTMREALMLALAQTEQIERLEIKVATDAPKVAFAETIRALDGVCTIESIAKTLGIGRNKLFKRLKADKVLMQNNLPYQKYIDREYFTVAEGAPYIDSKKESHPTFSTRVTGAGQVFLAKKYAAPEMESAL
ncbi:phage regulatory protein/antirepressor Ant [Massilia antarctica]|uniref:phage regulatory protein/antirepressor Ant n=1 Tax=Massilia antarctica TaxID=2765360 RepID=UPI00226E892C|nr:phage regulatory protein/antirepressor Ant [Massilia sp. H27-R4]MCY0910873.1 phage regulatory protein/antirepressor Ant [Massilia sp. H27-R4]